MSRELARECSPEVESHILRTIDELGSCTLTKLVQALPDYSWNQVFLIVDRLSREGELTLRRHPHVFEYLLEPRMQQAG